VSLRQKQVRFARMVGELIEHAFALGYEVTLGDAYRDSRVHGEIGEKKGYGHPKSCHKLRLAIDLHLFKDGVYRIDTRSHQPLGEWWEARGGTWGGRFNDANHYSLEHDGMR
jgi:hypothetical protein